MIYGFGERKTPDAFRNACHKFVFEESSDDSGWAPLATFGSYLNKLQPDFDSRLYGFKKLSDLVKGRSDLFVTEERQTSNGGQKVLYLRAVAV